MRGLTDDEREVLLMHNEETLSDRQEKALDLLKERGLVHPDGYIVEDNLYWPVYKNTTLGNKVLQYDAMARGTIEV
jgi:hypothetical protein